MTKKYSGFLIEVRTKQRDILWAAEISIWPAIGSCATLIDDWQTEGWASQGEAEDAGLQMARERIDAYVGK